MKLIRGVSIIRSITDKAVIIKTKKGEARVTTATLENIVKLNKKLGTYPYNASRKLSNFIYEELEKDE